MYSRVSYSIESSDPDNSVLIDRAISRVLWRGTSWKSGQATE